MAPPTGPRGGAASRRRDGNRSSTGTLGGGVSKRRANTGTDRDGDVSMDAPAGGSTERGGRGNRGPRGSRGASRTARNIRAYAENGVDDVPSKGRYHRQVLKVHGLKSSKAANNPDGGLRGLIEFIERKASKDKQVKIGKRAMTGDCVWINVSKDDAPAVLHLNGYLYAGATLTITETEERVPYTDGATTSAETGKRSKEATELKQKLESVLASRFKPAEAFLDLSALGADPTLSQMGTFQSESTAMKAFRALLMIVSETYKNARDKEESIQAVSVANNMIDDVSAIFQLALELPGLKRLDLSNNKFDSISKLAKWKGQFRYLEELHLTGNQVVVQENYVAELLSWFPYLQVLNGVQVRTQQQIQEYIMSRSGTPLDPGALIVVRDAIPVAEAFVRDLIALYDSDRAGFAEKYYDEESEFSLQTPSAPRPTHAWTCYVKHSRNLERAHRTNRSAITKRLHIGVKQISDFWQNLPATQHFPPESGRWIIDSHLLPNIPDPSFPGGPGASGMILTLNSEFEEADASQNLFGTRGFSRTFILGPRKATAVAPGAQPAPQFRVVSDQLVLHAWTPRELPATIASSIAAPVAAPVAAPPIAPEVAPVTAPAGLSQLQLELIAKLSQQTGMTIEYSQLCLSGAPDWNYDLAVAAFEQIKATLPPTAFLNQAA